MADRICDVFFVPPISFARLGGSTTPLAAYRWEAPKNPRTEGETVVVPSWSLNILPDGRADPFLPDSLRFRDGNLLRPVCPFHEVWARVGDPAANPATWRDAPLTPALLQAEGFGLANLSFSITARNLKIQRRTGRAALAYGNFQPLVIPGDDHTVRRISGASPPRIATPMIPTNRRIPLATIQVLRPRPQPAAGAAPWAAEVRVDVVRLRFTPAPGLFYGPPQAATAGGADGPAVRASEAFLNASAGWFGSRGQGGGFVIPGDTFDSRPDNADLSLGVVDDTCEARIDLVLDRGARGPLSAHANVFVGPPDYAPDRRPFVSVADELNDRDGDSAARNAALTDEALDSWIGDLFERIYDCVSLMNVDFWRTVNWPVQGGGRLQLPAGRRAAALAGDGLPNPREVMGGEDALRNRTLRVGTATIQTPLPLAEHARARHRSLSDVDALRAFVLADPARILSLVRGPFEAEQVTAQQTEGLRQTTMRMPPFMAQSTPSTPLTLTAWQYDLVRKWVGAVQAPPAAPVAPAALVLSEDAALHRNAVLGQLDDAGPVR